MEEVDGQLVGILLHEEAIAVGHEEELGAPRVHAPVEIGEGAREVLRQRTRHETAVHFDCGVGCRRLALALLNHRGRVKAAHQAEVGAVDVRLDVACHVHGVEAACQLRVEGHKVVVLRQTLQQKEQ